MFREAKSEQPVGQGARLFFAVPIHSGCSFANPNGLLKIL
jgi:hypothetical protein